MYPKIDSFRFAGRLCSLKLQVGTVRQNKGPSLQRHVVGLLNSLTDLVTRTSEPPCPRGGGGGVFKKKLFYYCHICKAFHFSCLACVLLRAGTVRRRKGVGGGNKLKC